jgi:hypothetical protein
MPVSDNLKQNKQQNIFTKPCACLKMAFSQHSAFLPILVETYFELLVEMKKYTPNSSSIHHPMIFKVICPGTLDILTRQKAKIYNNSLTSHLSTFTKLPIFPSRKNR